MELGENKSTLEKEHKQYAEMSASFKEKQGHYAKQLNDLAVAK